MAAGHYTVIITNPDDTVLGTVTLDNFDLSNYSEMQFLGEKIADAMGGDAIANCAAMPVVEDEDDWPNLPSVSDMTVSIERGLADSQAGRVTDYRG